MSSKNKTNRRFGWMELFGPSALLVIIVLILGSMAISSALPAEPTAESVMADYITAIGGREAFDGIRNRVVEASLTIEGAGITLSGTIVSAKPNLGYTLFRSDAIGTIEKGTDGDLVWEKNTMSGPQIVEGAMREFTLREGTMDKLVYWQQVYSSAELGESMEVEGRDCHKVVLKAESGAPVILYIDKETHLALRQDITVESAMGTVPVESILGDYREVDGLLLPFKVSVGNLGQKRVIITTSVKHNVDLPADRFAVPADVMALVKPAEAAPAEKPTE